MRKRLVLSVVTVEHLNMHGMAAEGLEGHRSDELFAGWCLDHLNIVSCAGEQPQKLDRFIGGDATGYSEDDASFV